MSRRCPPEQAGSEPRSSDQTSHAASPLLELRGQGELRLVGSLGLVVLVHGPYFPAPFLPFLLPLTKRFSARMIVTDVRWRLGLTPADGSLCPQVFHTLGVHTRRRVSMHVGVPAWCRVSAIWKVQFG